MGLFLHCVPGAGRIYLQENSTLSSIAHAQAGVGHDVGSAVKNLKSQLGGYARPSVAASVFQLVTTLLLWAAGWAAMYWSMITVGYWLALLFALPTALLSVRIFILHHDCGHGSFFPSNRWNTWVGSVLGLLVVTPYHTWKRQHATHHAHNGNLDHRGIGDIDTATIREYMAMSKRDRLLYRLYRSPLVLFGIGPIWQFAIMQRIPSTIPKSWKKERRNIWMTNFILLGLAVALVTLGDWRVVVMLYLPVMAIAASVGVWLFYVQHQFNPTYWEKSEDWDYHTAAVDGSSHYDLPRWLHWLTANIGYHHIHHLDSRIPNYRLPKVHQECEPLQKADRLKLWQSLSCANLKLWDEDSHRLVSFREGKKIAEKSGLSPA